MYLPIFFNFSHGIPRFVFKDIISSAEILISPKPVSSEKISFSWLEKEFRSRNLFRCRRFGCKFNPFTNLLVSSPLMTHRTFLRRLNRLRCRGKDFWLKVKKSIFFCSNREEIFAKELFTELKTANWSYKKIVNCD